MDSMFYGCSELKELDVSGFDTSNVTNMYFMFYECESLTKLDLSNFELNYVVPNVFGMFYNNFLESIIIPKQFNDEANKNSFLENLKTEGLKFGKWKNVDTNQEYDNVPDSITESQKYQYIGETKTIIEGNWGTCSWSLESGRMTITGGIIDTVKEEELPWFEHKKEIQQIIITGKIAFQQETSFSRLFEDLRNVQYIDGLKQIDTSQINNMDSLFLGCKNLKEIDISNWKTSRVTSMMGMFEDCKSLEKINLADIDTSNVLSMAGMFYECSNLKEVDVSSFDTSQVKTMNRMFYLCDNLERLDLSNFNTSKVTGLGLQWIFAGCSKLKEVDVSSFDTSQVKSLSFMFSGCKSLEKLDVSNFNTSQIVYMAGVFARCSGLTDLDVTNFDTSQVMDIDGMFYGCNGITKLDLSSFDIGQVTNMADIFNGLNLSKITLPENTGDNHDIFVNELKKGMKTGNWYDVTAEITYEGLPDTMQEGHKYINKDTYTKDEDKLSGDIDGNGKVNLQDSALLRRYLAGWDVTIDENAADVDGNGKVNLQDSALLRRYLAGWDVTLK